MTDVRADQEDAEALVGEAGTAVGAAVGPQPTHLPVPRTARWGACAAALLVIAAGTATVLSVHHKHSVQADEASRRQVLAELRTRLPAALGYDYRHLDRDISQATSGLTPRFASDYRKLFETTIVPTATKYRGVVTAEVVAAGIESADRGHAQVLAFIDQTTTTRILPAPRVDSSRVRVKFRRVEGHWRIDAIDPL